ncbi:MAG: hypothetical protein HC930_14495 [Hydrococcus sp. SU_1_0]|nr:hypothetical protein [Hydrococcus sp. SU_1_0]
MLEKALTLVIPSKDIQDHDGSDLDNLLATYAITETARDNFLAGELTFDEYIQLLESAQLNVDSYLETLESNLVTFDLM